jgi:two-component system chemotaxis response regulator CheY
MANILIVDDTTFMCTALRKIVEEAGHTVVGEAVNGKQAFQKYQQMHPDVVLMDITMPDTDGIEGLKMIRKEDPQAIVIMVSAMGQQDKVVEAISSGAVDFVVKPFTEDRVIDALNKALKRKG